MQMLATRAVASLNEAREIIATCFPARLFEPKNTDRWEEAYQRFRALTANSAG
jgi:hypothetical protein